MIKHTNPNDYLFVIQMKIRRKQHQRCRLIGNQANLLRYCVVYSEKVWLIQTDFTKETFIK